MVAQPTLEMVARGMEAAAAQPTLGMVAGGRGGAAVVMSWGAALHKIPHAFLAPLVHNIIGNKRT